MITAMQQMINRGVPVRFCPRCGWFEEWHAIGYEVEIDLLHCPDPECHGSLDAIEPDRHQHPMCRCAMEPQ